MLKTVGTLRAIFNPLIVNVRNHPYKAPFVNFLRNLPATQCSALQNGLRVATEERNSEHVCVGLFFDAGSRYENIFENGIAHFFEHMAFKGSRGRARVLTEEQLSCTGARVRCVTTREMVAYYAECLNQQVPLVVTLLVEGIFNNLLLPAELENQKTIVYSEMLDHENDPVALLDDYLHITAFQGTPLAQTVMGPSHNLLNFDPDSICRYVQRMFTASRMVFVSVGGVKHEHMVTLVNALLGNLRPSESCVDKELYRFTGSEVRFRDDSHPKANVAIAFEGPPFGHSDNVAMQIAASMLGGWDITQGGGLNSAHRLARAGCAEHLCDAYRAFNINYKDTGLWGVHFMSASLDLEDMLYNIQDEFMMLCLAVAEGEVERGRRELKSRLLRNTASAVGACIDIGRWMLYNCSRPSIHERITEIDNIHSKQVQAVCNKYLYDRCPAVAAVGPSEGLPEYTRIRAGMYWLRF